MLASVSRSALTGQFKSSLTLNKAVRLMSTSAVDTKATKDVNSSTSKRSYHKNAPAKADASDIIMEKRTGKSGLYKRFYITAEVTVSKIFPAGFGWQSASIAAEKLGYECDSLAFALTTGLGDGVAVFGGHSLYYAVKKSITGRDDINLMKELQTGLWLGSAAFCSGTLWQPLVNVLQGANLSFSQVFFGTWVGCGSAFYLGLRAGRTFLSGPLAYIEEPTYDNSKNDASLSVAIGGATGFFVGTDAAYLPDQNFLIDVVGITDSVPQLQGCAIAGTSTSLGFMATQTGMNFAFPAKKCWND